MRGSVPGMRSPVDLAKEAEFFDRGERIRGHEGISAKMGAPGVMAINKLSYSELSRNENCNCDELLAWAEGELSVFFSAVTKLFGSEQATLATKGWLQRLEAMTDSPASPREWRVLSIAVSAGLAKQVNSTHDQLNPRCGQQLDGPFPTSSERLGKINFWATKNAVRRMCIACENRIRTEGSAVVQTAGMTTARSSSLCLVEEPKLTSQKTVNKNT